jgi:hypothetical protein
VGCFVWRGYIAQHETTTALREASQTADSFLASAQKQDYQTDQLYLTTSGQYTLSPDDLTKTFDLLTTQYGTWLSSDLTNRQLRNIAGLDMCSCDYTLTFDHGTVNVHLVLVRSYSGWRINTMTF